MAISEMLDAGAHASTPPTTLLQQLAIVLPKDTDFKIYHLSTPPTRASALYSAPSGTRPDRTYCESHFLTASIRVNDKGDGLEPPEQEALVFAIEVLIYSTAYDTTFFVSKADSTGFLHLLNLPKGTSSPLRDISGTFLKHLVQQRRRRGIRNIISLFARAQDQYLFPGSVEYHGKHVLDDRGLVRWWCQVLNPLVDEAQSAGESIASPWASVKGYLIVPGLDARETLSYIPGQSKTQWTIGHPLQQISRHSENVPPRCLVPHFPDDPKSRYLDELDDEITQGQDNKKGQWKSVKTIDQFWDMMAYRQECSAGRLVGFIWIVFTPPNTILPIDPIMGNSQGSAIAAENGGWNSSPPARGSETSTSPNTSFHASSQLNATNSPYKPPLHESLLDSQEFIASLNAHIPKKKTLTGLISTRQPRIKTRHKNYLPDIPESTAHYIWHAGGRGQVVLEESEYKRVSELLLRLDFENLEKAVSSSKRWISEVRSGASGDMIDAWGQTVSGAKEFVCPGVISISGVNTLSTGLVRKKRKVGTVESEAVSNTPLTGHPSINLLAGNVVRKKAKLAQ